MEYKKVGEEEQKVLCRKKRSLLVLLLFVVRVFYACNHYQHQPG